MLKKMLLTGIVMGCICSVAFGAEESNNRSPDIGFEVRHGKLVLDEKGDDYVMCCMRRLYITSYTLIKNERGMIISLDELDIPCEAMVYVFRPIGAVCYRN